VQNDNGNVYKRAERMEESKNRLSNIGSIESLTLLDTDKGLDKSQNSGGHPRGHVSRKPTDNETSDLSFGTDCVERYSLPNPKAKRSSKHPKTAFINKEDQNFVTHIMLILIASELKELLKTERKVKIEMSVREHCLFGEKRVPKVNEWKNGEKQHASDCSPKSFVMWIIRDETQTESPFKGFYIETIYPQLF
jgi:hypothetical protein